MRHDDPTPGLLAGIHAAIRDLHALCRSVLASRAVLSCETLPIDANGLLTRDWSIPFKAVAVTNHGATDPMTVTSMSPGVAAPTGVGVARVDAGKSAVCNVAGNALTIYGTPGDIVTLQVFAGAQPAAWGA
jgi:hypothetical protein